MDTFGYKNSPRQFLKAVAKSISGLLYLGTISYIDDIINYAKNFDELFTTLEKLLLRIRETGFKLKASKCKFGYFELKILGQIEKSLNQIYRGWIQLKNFQYLNQ